QRETDPRNHHGPALDAAMPVNALFQRVRFQNAVNVERERLLHQAFHADRPWTRAEVARQPGGLILVGAELVVVVVIGDVLERRLLLARAEGALTNRAGQ